MKKDRLQQKLQEFGTEFIKWAKGEKLIDPDQHIDLSYNIRSADMVSDIRVTYESGIYVWRPLTEINWEQIFSVPLWPICKLILNQLKLSENKPMQVRKIITSVGEDEKGRRADDYRVQNDINTKLLHNGIPFRIQTIFIDNERGTIYTTHHEKVRRLNLPDHFVILTKVEERRRAYFSG